MTFHLARLAIIGIAATAALLGTADAAVGAAGDRVWEACTSEHLPAQDRIAACSEIIARAGAPADIVAEALFMRARLLAEQGDRQSAIADLTRSLELAPNIPGALLERGNQFLAMRNYEQALADYTDAIRANPRYAPGYMNRGISRRRLGDLGGAVADYTDAIRIDPNYAQAFYNRGVALGQLGETGRAMADFDQAIRLAPDYARAYSGRCWVRTLTHSEPERGIADCNRALHLLPEDPTSLDNRGFLNLLLRNDLAAYQDYAAAVRADPHYAGSLYGRGLARVRLGQREQGEADMQAALEMDPTAAETFTSLRR